MTLSKKLDGFKIKRTELNNKKKRYKIRLHDRLELLKIKDNGRHKEIAETLLTIKLIGNDGSHSLINLTRSDTLDCYELIEDILEKVYDNRKERLIKIQKKIQKKKGKIKTSVP